MGERLEAARAGDERAFEDLVGPFVPELHRHCYRMLGSLHAAQDAVQETLLSAWRSLPGFEARSSVRTWLFRIATSRCLNAIRDGARRPPEVPLPPFEPPQPTSVESVTWVEPHPDAAGGRIADLEFAFVCALQVLPPRQAAALLLCDVLDFRAVEVAAMLEATPTSIKGLLQRARAALPPREPPVSMGDEAALAAKFADAYARDDIETMLSLLTDRSWLAMPPAPHRYDGPDAIAGFLSASAAGRPGRYSLTWAGWAGGHPTYTCWLGGRDRGTLLVAVQSDGTAIRSVHRFLA